MKKLLLVALVCAGVVPGALGQTGRIAHFSHGGSVGALVMTDEENLGIPYGLPKPTFVVDSIRYVSPSKIVEYGKWLDTANTEKERTILLPQKMSPATAGRYLRRHPELRVVEYRADDPDFKVKYLGFDSTSHSIRPPHELKRKSTKPAGQLQAFPKRPFQYSYWRGLSAVVALGTVGWLLGKKRPA